MAPRSVDEVIDAIGFGWAQWRLILFGGGVWAADGAELIIISSITNTLSSDLHLSGAERGLVVTLCFVGMLLGNGLSGTLGDLYGRRLPILVSYGGICFLSCLSAAAWDIWSMGACRVLVGIAFGVGQPACNTLCTEMSPTESRVFVNAAAQFLFTFGEIYSAALLWADDPELEDLHWRTLLMLAAIPAFVLGGFAYFNLLESPKYFASAGQDEKAREVLEAVRIANGCSPDVPLDYKKVATTQAHGEQCCFADQMKIVFGARLRFTSLVTCMTIFVLNFITWGGFYAFPQVLPALKLDISPGANIFLGVLVEIPGYILGAWIANRVTRKVGMLSYLVAALVSIALFLYGTGMDVMTLSATGDDHIWAIQAGFVGIKACVALGFIVAYTYASEVYPTAARTTGCAICLAVGRLGAMACPLMYDFLKERTGTFHAFFVLIAWLACVNSVFVAMLSIETAGKELSDELEPICAVKP